MAFTESKEEMNEGKRGLDGEKLSFRERADNSEKRERKNKSLKILSFHFLMFKLF